MRKQIFLYLLFSFLMLAVIAQKENYYIDELFSYGLANHIWEDGESISPSPKLAPYVYESGGAPFMNILRYSRGSGLIF